MRVWLGHIREGVVLIFVVVPLALLGLGLLAGGIGLMLVAYRVQGVVQRPVWRPRRPRSPSRTINGVLVRGEIRTKPA